VLLHEIAHCAAPHYVVEDLGPRFRQGELLAVSHRQHLDHGPFFAATLAVITDNLLPGDSGELATAIRHFEAPVATSDELRAELDGQPAIIADEEWYRAEVARVHEEFERFKANYVAKHGEPAEPVIPSFHWGIHLRFTRRDHHRGGSGRLLSQQRLAEAISAVVPCTARHISQLEHSKERPEDPLQLKRAMLATIFLGLDPIWTRYNLELARWDCGDITMDDARKLNPAWADLVDHINELLDQMPPRWAVEGAR